MQEFSVLAHKLANISGEIARKHFRQPFDVETKADKSPVTIADRAIEQAMRDIIEQERPDDGIYGEEFGIKESKNGLTWVLDPIDGTKSFVIGRPTFGTLIALCENDKPILGVINQPISKERWINTGNGRTLFNDQRPKTRKCISLSRAAAGSTTPAMFAQTGPVYERFEKECKMMIWGGDCYMYGLLALGHMDICVEANLSPYDFCALVPIVEGSGGIMTDWNGKPLTIKSDGKVLACGDKNLHAEALKLLR
ncbi:MAG: histidinol-phosphatase [Alphaproteobacteria bacterium]